MMTRRCGRLGDHDPHDWVGNWNEAIGLDGWPSGRVLWNTVYHCTGKVQIEGGWGVHSVNVNDRTPRRSGPDRPPSEPSDRDGSSRDG